MSGKTIVTCAVTGSITRPDQHPDLPVTPEQIAGAAIDAAKAGAAVAHIHVRDPKTGAPSMALDLYREVVERIRGSDTDLIINLSTGAGGRFVPGDDDPKVAGPGTTLVGPERRVEHVTALRPELCSLDLNTMWFGSAVVMNPPRNVRIMARAMRDAGVMPELEVFDSGDIVLAHELLADASRNASARKWRAISCRCSRPSTAPGSMRKRWRWRWVTLWTGTSTRGSWSRTTSSRRD